MKNKMMKTALLASVVAILSACGGDGDNKPTTQATNTVPSANNNQSGNGSTTSNKPANTGSETSNKPTNTGSQTSNKPANSGSQANNSSPNTHNQTGNKPATNGSQTSNTPANSGSQANNSSPSTHNQTGNKPATNSLTLNENPHLFANENKFLVKLPTDAQKQQLVIALADTNKLRAEKGLPALKYDATLAAYAQRRAEEIVGRFDHKLPDSDSKYHVNIATGGAGENIAAGNATGAATIEQWRNSKGHYENMVRPSFTKIGIGVVEVPGSQFGYYWVQIFGFDDTSTDYVFDNTQSERHLDKVTANTASALTNQYQFINVDNVQLYLGEPNRKGVWESFDRKGYSGQIYSHNDVRFGVMKQGSGSLKVFHTGRNTEYEDMPQTGSANYTGKAVITDGKTLNTNLDAQFKADFGDKKLTGVLSEKGNRVVDINAHIRGSTFHSPQNAPVETQGGFFGKTANELGGVFHENATGKFGAFGAKR